MSSSFVTVQNRNRLMAACARKMFMAAEHLAPMAKRGIHIVRAGHASGQPNRGVEAAPSVIIDHHNLPMHLKNTGSYEHITVSDSYDDYDDYDKVTVGGDHMVAYDSIAYQLTRMKNTRLGVIWIDAHADINSERTSDTGNKHGMVLSSLMGRCDSVRGKYDVGDNPLLPENLVYVGLRSVDPPERSIINREGIANFNSDMVNLTGGSFHINCALLWYLRDCDHIHVSFDVDVMDPKQFPATGTPVPGGISFRCASQMAHRLFNDHRVRSMDLVEYDPLMDDKDLTCGLMATDIITTTFTNGYSFDI